MSRGMIMVETNNYPCEKVFGNGNRVVFIDKNTWKLEVDNFSISANLMNYYIDWLSYPKEHKDLLMQMFLLGLENRDIQVVVGFHYCLKYIYKYLNLMNYEGVLFYKFTETEWGGFIKWLSKQEGWKYGVLSHTTTRTYLSAVKSILKACEENGFLNIDEEDIDAISNVMKRRFRDSNLLTLERNGERSLTEEEADNLYKIVNEEWLVWKENPRQREVREQDLLAITALWLAFDEGIRPEEINAMVVGDITDQEDGNILIHAPNKPHDIVKFSDKAMEMLNEVIETGKGTRILLKTDRLFVDSTNHTIVGSKELNFRIRKLIDKYHVKYPIDRKDIILADGRKTLGSAMASVTNNEENVRRALRHATPQTARKYYIKQNKIQLSKNIYKSMGRYAVKLSQVYSLAVVDPEKEIEGFDHIKQSNPNYENKYGACSKDILKEGKCLKSHCGKCPKLIILTSKRKNWVTERDVYKILANQISGTLREERLAHAQMCQQYIDLIDRRLEQIDA